MKTILYWDPRFPGRSPKRLTLADAVASAFVRAGVAAPADPGDYAALSAGGALSADTLVEVVLQHGINSTALGRYTIPLAVAQVAVTAGLAAWASGQAASAGVTPTPVTQLSIGSNRTLSLDGSPHVPLWLTAWDYLYQTTPSSATALGDAAVNAGYTGVEINLLNGSIIAPNLNGRVLLPSSDPLVPNLAFLADCVPLINALAQRNLTIVINLVWGAYINNTGQKLFTAFNSAVFAAAIAQWLKLNWPTYANLVVSLMADNHPLSKSTSTGAINVGTTVNRVDVTAGGSGYTSSDTVTSSSGAYRLEVVGGVVVGVKIDTPGTSTTLTINSATGSGAAVSATMDQNWLPQIEAMATTVRNILGNRALITLHAAVPSVGANANFDGAEIVLQGLGDCYATPPSWCDMILLQSGHNRARARASAYENMARKERGRANWQSIPVLDAENGYNEIPAALPADVSPTGMADNAMQTAAGSNLFTIVFAAPHGLTTPTDGGKRRYVCALNVPVVGDFNINGWNCEVVAVVNSVTLQCQHPALTCATTTTGSGTSISARLRTEYIAADRLPPYHLRQRAWQGQILGYCGHCESAEGLYGMHNNIVPQNEKYNTAPLFMDALAAMTAAKSQFATQFFRQRPMVLRVPQPLTAGVTASFVRIYGSNAQFYLNSVGSGGRQNLQYNAVQGAVASDASYAVVYSLSGQEFDLNLADYLTQGSAYNIYWINPRTGAADTGGRVYVGGSYSSGAYVYSGGTEYAAGAVRSLTVAAGAAMQAAHFMPPTTDTTVPLTGTITTRIDDGKDWVLVIEKAGAYPALALT